MERKVLKEVIDKITTGLNPRNNFRLNENGTIRYITIKNIKKGKLVNLESCDLINQEAFDIINKRSDIQKNDVLFNSIGSNGDAYLVEETPTNWNVNESVFSIRANECVLPRYLYYLLTNIVAIRYYLEIETGSTFKSIKQNKLKELPVNIYDKDRQKEIVIELDNINLAIENRKAQLEDLDNLVNSKFAFMFGNVFSNEKNWKQKKLEDIVLPKIGLKRGPFGGALKKEIFQKDGYLVYEQYHAIYSDFVTNNRYFIDKQKYNEMESFKLEPGDLIVSCSGTYGKISEIPQDNFKQGIINQALLRIKLDNTKIMNDFFVFQFRHDFIQNLLFNVTRGGTINNFPPMSEFKKTLFIVPDIPIQEQFVDFIHKCNKQKEMITQDIHDLDALLCKKMIEYFG